MTNKQRWSGEVLVANCAVSVALGASDEPLSGDYGHDLVCFIGDGERGERGEGGRGGEGGGGVEGGDGGDVGDDGGLGD